MSAEPADFARNSVATALLGTWRFPVSGEISGIGMLHFTETGRAIQFLFNPNRSRSGVPMRLWYSIESLTDLRFRPKHEHEGWLRSYRLQGDTLTLAADDREWTCKRPTPNEIPEWFAEALESALLG